MDMFQLQLESDLAEGARDVLRMLDQHGHQAYMVGGCVRDTILGRPIHDIDIATSAEPDQVCEMFERVIPTGLQHGTVTVVTKYGNYEVTTFRREGGYVDNRRPESVEFITDVTEDLRRRDFTMNAMAVDADGTLLDPFAGQVDLRAYRVRTVGKADERFSEDALRMLRAIRFASVLQMRIAKGTWRALVKLRPGLAPVAMERVREELWKLTAGPDPARGWAFVVRSGILAYAKEPLLFLAHPWSARWQSALAVLGQMETPELRFALLALVHGASAEEAQAVCLALRLSGAQQDGILPVLRAHAQLAAAAQAASAAASPAQGAASAGEAALRRAFAQAVLAYGETAVRGALACRQAMLGVSEGKQPAAALQAHIQPESVDSQLQAHIQPEATDAQQQAADELQQSYAPPQSDCSLLRMAPQWLEAMPARQLSDLAIKGRDILAASDRPAGPWIRAILERVWLEVAIGALPNERDALMNEATKGEDTA
ncbi:CCA tRNA nucleotidyltransferase [Paenibacillus agilis]|uniref:CCA tRNA nucleotidyltransferase n=1 Tax=Paenibacillus agilis TaxID=3020863 RepID=A0A559IZ59_9BACL|nr:CCA tRNA nucleotidyltransferase [Paenibacillus agilis]TVX92919.1 CCA tRNA nucleotidyltransferase [Paenibacillus agilis]